MKETKTVVKDTASMYEDVERKLLEEAVDAESSEERIALLEGAMKVRQQNNQKDSRKFDKFIRVVEVVGVPLALFIGNALMEKGRRRWISGERYLCQKFEMEGIATSMATKEVTKAAMKYR